MAPVEPLRLPSSAPVVKAVEPVGDISDPNYRKREIGKSGLLQYAGRLYEEWMRELQGDRGRKNLGRMVTDEPFLAASDSAMRLLMRQVPWSVKAAGGDETAVHDQEFLTQCMVDMSLTWSDFVDDVLSMLRYGWSYFETVYKVRYRKGHESRYNDGAVGWRKHALRPQESLDHWDFDASGGVQGMWQRDPTGAGLYLIPIEKALLFRTVRRKNSPEGASIYRGAWRPYKVKVILDVLEPIIIERDGTGIPKFEAPADYFQASNVKGQAFLAMLKQAGTDLKADEQQCLIAPQSYDAAGNKQFDYSLLSTPGRRSIEIREAIQARNVEMLMVTMTDFLLLGHANVGSFALSADKSNLLSVALTAYLDSIAQVLNTYAVPRLFELNGWEREAYPEFVHGAVEKAGVATAAQIVSQLSSAGFPMPSALKISDEIMRRLDLPTSEDA